MGIILLGSAEDMEDPVTAGVAAAGMTEEAERTAAPETQLEAAWAEERAC